MKKSVIVKKREDDSSSDSDSSDDDSDGSGKNHLRTVKKEKVTSESSSSDSSDDSTSENGDLLVNRIKMEKDDDSSFAVPSLPIVLRPIKTEPMSDVEGGKTHKNSPVIASKKRVAGKRTLSMSEHLDSLLADAIHETPEKNKENGSSKKKRKPTLLDETNLGDLTAAFRSPAMSSTLIPKSSPAKVKKEVQSEDERPKKKKNKNATKSSLENIESELFESYAG